jgi:ATP-binding cassette subfamily B multidrug efflux pump
MEMVAKKAPKQNNHVLRHLFQYVKGYWRDTILTWIFVLIESVCEVLVVFFMQYLIDGVHNEDVNIIYIYSGVIAGTAICAAVFGIFAGIFAASSSAGFGKNLREAMFVQIQKYSFKNIDKFSTSSIVTRTTTDVTNVQNAFMQIIRAVIRAPFMMVFALIMCFVTEPKLAWIFLVIIPVCLIGLFLLAIKVHPIFVKVFETYDQLNQTVQENVDGIRVVKSFDQEEEQKANFHGVSLFIYKSFVRAEKIMAFNGPLLNLAVYAAILCIAYFGSELIVSSKSVDLSVGGMSTLITYVMVIMMSLMLVSMVFVMIMVGRNSAERIVEVLVEQPDIVSPQNPIKTIANGQIDFNHVFFAYNGDKYVLKDIDYHFKPGTTIGVLGSTGAGKTTLISLIARLYDPSKGSVEVGGVDVKKYDLVSLRDSVAVVLQKNTLFTGTIKDNLLWGNASASDEEIAKACDIAQVTPFLKDLPDGLLTKLDEGGTNVSGGQKQRICIARALLKNPKVLILDDSTSACDTHTDALIRQGLSTERKDVTKFVIAQRVLSVKDCDVILVMNEGVVVASGTSDELLKSCSVYKELYQSQLGGGDFDARN